MIRPAVAALVLSLAACAGQVQTATVATVSQAQTRLQAALTLYGVAKGLAQVAVVADPGLATAVAMVTAAVDPAVARAQLAVNDATIDAAAIDALAASIKAQADALTLAAAPAVKVVPAA